MKILIDSQIRIKDVDKVTEKFIKDELEIINPEIQKKKAMGFWTGQIPKTLKAYSRNGNDYIIPIGEINNIWNLHPIKEDYIIDFGNHEKLNFPKCNVKLYDYQEKAVQEMIKAKRGILSSKCGSGKSIMLLEIIRRIGFKTLIICEKKEILKQFENYLKTNFGMNKGDYGIVAEGKVEIGEFITIGLRQTLARIDLTQYKFEFGIIAVDECQNVGGSVTKCTQYSKILNNLAAEYRFGVSGTAFRTDGLTRFMHSLLNTIKYEIPEEEIADKVIKAQIQPIYTNYVIPRNAKKVDYTLDYTKMPSVLAENEERNQLILDLLKENKDNYNLVLSDRLEGLEILYKQLGQGKFINGQMTSKAAKKEREEAIQLMRDKKEHYLFASFSLAKEGLDIKSLNRLFLIAPTKNKIVLIQSVGRIERSEEGKNTPIVYDFVDINSQYYEKAWKTRKTIYRKNGNKILE